MALRHVEGPDKQQLTRSEVAAYLGVHERTLKRMIARGEFPAGVRVSEGVEVWPWLDAVAWVHLRQRLSEHSEATPAEVEKKSKRTQPDTAGHGRT